MKTTIQRAAEILRSDAKSLMESCTLPYGDQPNWDGDTNAEAIYTEYQSLAAGLDNAVAFTPGETTLADLERQLIEKTLAHFNGDKQKAAEALGISLKTIYNRLNYYAMQDARSAA